MVKPKDDQFIDTRDDSPFPSGSMMDLDMYRAGAVITSRSQHHFFRRIESVGETVIAEVSGTSLEDPVRDTFCRRVEMMGDLYETLRRATEKMTAAGMSVAEEHEVLAAFCTPKPFGGQP